jgi:GxxExxY protein
MRLLSAIQAQVSIPMKYDGQSVGGFTADMAVEDKVVVELKSLQRLI